MTKINDLLHSLGVPNTYIGFHQLCDSIQVAAKDEYCLLAITKRIYPVVAENFSTSAPCVERNIRTVIESFWNNGDRKRLDILAGYHVTQKPCAGEFISIVSVYMNRNFKDEI